MKVMQRGVMKVVPGKMAEAMELNKKHMTISSRYGMPANTMRMYRPWLGGEHMHTVIFEIEWDSLAEMEAFFDKVMADPEMQALMPKWDELLDSHQVEVYMSMS